MSSDPRSQAEQEMNKHNANAAALEVSQRAVADQAAREASKNLRSVVGLAVKALPWLAGGFVFGWVLQKKVLK